MVYGGTACLKTVEWVLWRNNGGSTRRDAFGWHRRNRSAPSFPRTALLVPTRRSGFRKGFSPRRNAARMLGGRKTRASSGLPPSGASASTRARILGGPSLLRPKSYAAGMGSSDTGVGRPRKNKGLRRSLSAWPHRMDGSGLRRRTNPDYTDVAYREAVSRLRYLLAESYGPTTTFQTSTTSRVSYNVPHHQMSQSRRGEDSGDDTDFSAVHSEKSAPRQSHRTPSRPTFYGATKPYAPPASPYKATAARLGIGTHTGDGQQQGTASGDSQQPPPELMAFIQRQEEYIDQLEKESQYCRDELAALLGKVKDVISENEELHDKQKCGLMKSMFDYLDTEEEEYDDEGDDDIGDDKEVKREKRSREDNKSYSKPCRLEGPSIVFESRITELEAQLSQAKIDLEKYKTEAENLKKQLSNAPPPQTLPGTPSPDLEACQNEVDNLRREKNDLRDTIAKLQAQAVQLRESESNASHKVKRAQDALEQAQFEKNQADLEVHRLKDELDRQHQRLRDTIQDQARKVAEERASVERRFLAQTEQLNNELLTAREEIARLTLELERQRRNETEMRRELSLRATSGDELQRELQAKIAHLQAELSSAASARGVVEQEASGARFAAERSEREARAEATRLNAEVGALRQRMERTDAELLRSREECLRLSEQISSLQRELSLAKLSRTSPDKGFSEDSNKAAEKREKEVTAMIQEMEAKHVHTVRELEGMIQSQNEVMAKLKDECVLLTEKLEDASARHKGPQENGWVGGASGAPLFPPPLQQPKKVKVNVTVKVSRKGVTKPKRAERSALRNENILVGEKLKSIWRVSEALQAQCLEHAGLYNQMSLRMEDMEARERESSEQIYKLLTNQSRLLKERDIMLKELQLGKRSLPKEMKRKKSQLKNPQQPPLTWGGVPSHHHQSLPNSHHSLPNLQLYAPPLPNRGMGEMMPPEIERGMRTTWAEVKERDLNEGRVEEPLDGVPVDVAGPLTLEDLATVCDT